MLLQSVVQKLDHEVGLCIAARRLSKSSSCMGIEIVRGWFMVIGERQFYSKRLLLRAVATEQIASFLAS